MKDFWRVLAASVPVGMANAIPGVSGGTVMLMTGIYGRVMEAIHCSFSGGKEAKAGVPRSMSRGEAFVYLLTVLAGAGVGLGLFAYLIDFLLSRFYLPTMVFFGGLILFSLPILVKDELVSGGKEPEQGPVLHSRFPAVPLPFGVGTALILPFFFLRPESSGAVLMSFSSENFLRAGVIFSLFLSAFTAGFSMFLPGVSGSMVLLVLGVYPLFISTVKHVIRLREGVFLPFLILAGGALSGVVTSAKISRFFLNRYERGTKSFLIGLVTGSCALIFFTAFRGGTGGRGEALSGATAFLLSAGIMFLFSAFANRKKQTAKKCDKSDKAAKR